MPLTGPCQLECVRDETRANNREDCGCAVMDFDFGIRGSAIRGDIAHLQSAMPLHGSRASGLDRVIELSQM